jgi:hypothetical protein
MPCDTLTAGQLDQILKDTRRRENSMSKGHQQKAKFRRKDLGKGRRMGKFLKRRKYP